MSNITKDQALRIVTVLQKAGITRNGISETEMGKCFAGSPLEEGLKAAEKKGFYRDGFTYKNAYQAIEKFYPEVISGKKK